MNEINRLLPDLHGIFNIEEASFIFDSMKEGNSTSLVYTDNIEKPNVSTVWDKGHCFYFAGDTGNKAAYGAVLDNFKGVLHNERYCKEMRIAKLYYPSIEWENSLCDSLKEYNPILGWRSLYRYDLQNVTSTSSKRKDVAIREIDEGLIENQSLGNMNAMLDEINSMWGSVKNFLHNGFGYCALVDESIACWCTAEYVSEKSCGIGIETVEEFQRTGIASLTAAIFLARCKEDRITPHWDCWKRNIPSVKTAERLGFYKLKDYKVVLLQLAD